MVTEQETVRQAWAKILRQANSRERIEDWKIRPQNDLDILKEGFDLRPMNIMVGLGPWRDIVYAPGILNILTLDELEGLLAHEYGHRVVGRDELKADKWAAMNGYGPALAAAFRKASIVDPENGRNGDELLPEGARHPRDSERIAAIEQWHQEYLQAHRAKRAAGGQA